jgi:hypothetical protein
MHEAVQMSPRQGLPPNMVGRGGGGDCLILNAKVWTSKRWILSASRIPANNLINIQTMNLVL